MSEPRSTPWISIAVEAAAIVVSILLAFAIDAWWTEKKESDVEYVALQALRSDFVSSREQMVVVLQSLEYARKDFARFQSAAPAELVDINPDAIRQIISGLIRNHTFDPVTATLDALANDGRLGLISDAQLLKRLSRWRSELDNIEDISFELRTESVLVRRAMEKHGGPFLRWRRGPDNFEVLRRADGETLANLRRDADFMGTARSHQFALAVYLVSLRQLAELLDKTVVSLDQVIASR
jgi:hypothetical protein